MSAPFPWYDSHWLRRYVAAKTYLLERYPRRAPDFIAAFAPLRTRPDFQVRHLERAFDDETVNTIRTVIRSLSFDELEVHEMKPFGRFVAHDHPVLQPLHEAKADLVSDLTGEAVEPSYSFLSMYTKLGRCEVHMDTPFAKWTLDICIDQSEPWPIHFSQIVPWPEDFAPEDDTWSQRIKTDPNHTFSSYALAPGEALLFSGSSQWHYRDPLPRTGHAGFCHLLFLHFMPKGMSEILKEENWAAMMDVHELTDVVLGVQ